MQKRLLAERRKRIKNVQYTVASAEMLVQGVNVTISYQEDLRKWISGSEEAGQEGSKQSPEERRKWTRKQVKKVRQEATECILPELEALCKKKGISVWSVEFYNPDFFKKVLENSRKCAMQEIIEEMGIKEWYSPHQLRTLVKQKNAEYNLDRYHRKISCDDIQEYDPIWFSKAFSRSYVTLPDIIEKKSPPQYRKVLDGEYG